MVLLLITIGFISIHYKRINDFNWRIGGSNPKNFMVNQVQVNFFYNNEWISGALLGTGGNNGWEEINGMIMGSDYLLSVPDSITTKWVCDTDKILYEGSYKLPREKMLELFRTKAIDSYGDQNDYNLIVVGMAPGGNVTVWMRGGSASTEICRFKANNKGIWKEDDPDYDKYTKEHESLSEGFKESRTYLKIHGIPYSAWEKGEKEYNYDIGFSSEENYDYNMLVFTKDCSWYSLDYFNSYIPWNTESIKTTNTTYNRKHYKCPVQLNLQWNSNEDNYKERRVFFGNIVLPVNLESKLATNNFNRFLVSIQKDTDQDSVFGYIYLIGKRKKEKVMNFKLGRYDYKKSTLLAPEYILPKDFVFPKWEGREPIVFPELDYWQEK
jgi:hypothetical protein